ncbi:hypothetical protein RIF29_17351 [Crotalaria pallida]|uniref:Uncharacterized protein n=1 Tax=Crotalaria pallida TaxID=3830 RepID=A0AAN9FI00_CROPI
MASKLMLLKERKKPNKDSTNNELEVVKAAAWAWYQHGSGSRGKAVSEFDASRTTHHHHHHAPPKPSRYKLEALMKMDKESEDEGSSSIQTKNNSLLDAYEIESISRTLDNFIELESKHNKFGKGSNPANNNASLDDNGDIRMKQKKILRKWFWPGHGAICCTVEDVIDAGSLRYRHRWMQIK